MSKKRSYAEFKSSDNGHASTKGSGGEQPDSNCGSVDRRRYGSHYKPLYERSEPPMMQGIYDVSSHISCEMDAGILTWPQRVHRTPFEH